MNGTKVKTDAQERKIEVLYEYKDTCFTAQDALEKYLAVLIDGGEQAERLKSADEAK